MTTQVGVGHSVNPDSREAGRDAAAMALDTGGVDAPGAALVFQTAKHDPTLFLAGVRSVLGPDASVVGATREGSSPGNTWDTTVTSAQSPSSHRTRSGSRRSARPA